MKVKWNWQLKRDVGFTRNGGKYHFILHRVGQKERRSAVSRWIIAAIFKTLFSKPFKGSFKGENE